MAQRIMKATKNSSLLMSLVTDRQTDDRSLMTVTDSEPGYAKITCSVRPKT